jgi:hypothetical protein
MKRFFCFLIFAFVTLSLCSCSESVNMGVLTEYRNGDFEAELKLSRAGKEQLCSLESSGGRFFLRFYDKSDFTFVMDESGAGIISGGTEIPLGIGAFPLYELYRVFFVPVAGAWKIEKTRLGGVSVYICESEGITLYIDASSHLPLKVVSEGLEADVLSFRTK